MKIEDMTLLVEEIEKPVPKPRRNSRLDNEGRRAIKQRSRVNLKYTITGIRGETILVPDLAARIGRKPTSVYQLLKKLGLGVHTGAFRALIQKSAARNVAPRVSHKKQLFTTDAVIAFEVLRAAYVRCMPSCLLERWHETEARAERKFEEWREAKTKWLDDEVRRRNVREAIATSGGDSLKEVPHVAAPVKPEHVTPAMPLCSCGRAAAEQALRNALLDSPITEVPNAAD
jgi:hypothetical protein